MILKFIITSELSLKTNKNYDKKKQKFISNDSDSDIIGVIHSSQLYDKGLSISIWSSTVDYILRDNKILIIIITDTLTRLLCA